MQFHNRRNRFRFRTIPELLEQIPIPEFFTDFRFNLTLTFGICERFRNEIPDPETDGISRNSAEFRLIPESVELIPIPEFLTDFHSHPDSHIWYSANDFAIKFRIRKRPELASSHPVPVIGRNSAEFLLIPPFSGTPRNSIVESLTYTKCEGEDKNECQ